MLSLTGLALGGVDFENPPGDPGLFGPQSVIWQAPRFHPDGAVSGVSALLLQMLYFAGAGRGVGSPNFREDRIGRLPAPASSSVGTTWPDR